MTTITDLTIEVIYNILQQKIIDIEDVVNFSLTCRRFNDALDNNLLWRTKLYQRWPYLKIYDNRKQNKESINFKDEVKASVKCRKALFSYLSLLSEKHFNYKPPQSCEPSDSDLKNFDILFRPNIGAHTMNYHFLKDELLYQIKMSPLHPKCNLTHQYYSKILLPFLQRRHLEDVCLEFMNYPKEQQLLENAATIVAQWHQPQKRIYNLDIEASLDDIAQRTLNSLKKAHWDHPIFSTSAKQFSFWKYNNINYNQWSKIEGKQIIDALRMVLFDGLGFRLHSTSNPKLEDIFIDCVLESKIGNAMTLSIIFQSVARRLGVRCDSVDSDFGRLFCRPRFVAENPEDKEYFYIDILHGGTIRSRNDCPIRSYETYKMCPTRMVFIMEILSKPFINQHWTRLRLAWMQMESVDINLVMCSPDTLGMIYRCLFGNKKNMSRILFSCQASLWGIQNDYNNRKSVEASRLTEDIPETFEMSVQCMNANLQISRNLIVPKNRTRNVKYAVGMIVACRLRNGSYQTGVIIGWDEKFDLHLFLKYKYTIVSNCTNCDTCFQCCGITRQPCYIILSENGKVYYAAQDTLIESTPRWIEHSEIGRFFCRFTNDYYVPNEVLTRHYPYDQAIILNIYGAQKQVARKKEIKMRQ